jgi:hypothetical protein
MFAEAMFAEAMFAKARFAKAMFAKAMFDGQSARRHVRTGTCDQGDCIVAAERAIRVGFSIPAVPRAPFGA